MLHTDQTLDTERYLLQCRRLLFDQVQQSGAGLHSAGDRTGAPPACAGLGPAAWLRPAICIASGLALGAPLERVLPVAAGLELFQAGIPPGRLPAPLAGTLRAVGARMLRETREGQRLQERARGAPLSAQDELRRLHKQVGWGAFIPAALLGSLSAGARPELAAAMARFGLLLAIASHSADGDVRHVHARRARRLLQRLGQLPASVHQDFLRCLVDRCGRLAA